MSPDTAIKQDGMGYFERLDVGSKSDPRIDQSPDRSALEQYQLKNENEPSSAPGLQQVFKKFNGQQSQGGTQTGNYQEKQDYSSDKRISPRSNNLGQLDREYKKGQEPRDPVQLMKVWNDLQIDQWEDKGIRELDNDQFLTEQLNLDVDDYIDKTHEDVIDKNNVQQSHVQQRGTPTQHVQPPS